MSAVSSLAASGQRFSNSALSGKRSGCTPTANLLPDSFFSITRFIDGICRLRNKGASISYYLHVFLRGGRLWLVVQQRVRLLLTFFWKWMLRSAASVVAGCTYGIIAIVASMA